MRTKPLVGQKLWFGPRRWGGWGWTPVSWEGWLVTALTVAAVIALEVRYGDPNPAAPIALVVVGVLAACILKGTSPGGPSAARRFRAERERVR